MMPRYWLHRLGDGPKAHNVVGISPSNHGITAQELMNPARQIPGAVEPVEQGVVAMTVPAWPQLQHDHAFQREPAELGETTDGVRHTVTAPAYDDVVTPYTSRAPAEGEGRYVRSILRQDIAPGDRTPHVGMSYDAAVLSEVPAALES